MAMTPKGGNHKATGTPVLANNVFSTALGAQRPSAAEAAAAMPPGSSSAHSPAYHASTFAPSALLTPSMSDASVPLEGGSFGVLKPEAGAEALNSQYKDGRVRNPVPSKLKGKTDNNKGNFSVMHMDLATNESKEREGAAKRTSESTELAAKRAFKNGYVSLTRRKPPPVPENVKAAALVALRDDPAPSPSAAPAAVQLSTRNQPLTAPETKAEQARLLTLLRSLNPVLVVDQICKALAYFGGIPGAPAPASGAFPDSALANGSGGLFVGWIAEIFPNLGSNATLVLESARMASQSVDTSGAEPRPAEAAESSPAPAVPPKRGRGRPRGSKGTKARKDKGIKKGPMKNRKSADGGADTSGADPGTSSQPLPNGAAVADDTWVDVDDSMLDVSGNLGEHADFHPDIMASGADTTAQLPSQDPNAEASLTSLGKKRGRPKGSKNRPKDATAIAAVVPATVTPIPPPVIPSFPLNPTTAQNTSPKKKASASRPKAPKNRPPNSVDPSSSLPQPAGHGPSEAPASSGTQGLISNGDRTFSGVDFALSAMQPHSTAPDIATQSPSFTPANTTTVEGMPRGAQGAEAAKTGVKRKRYPKKVDKAKAGEANGSGNASTDLTFANGSAFGTVGGSHDGPSDGTATAPPAKKQRKSKDSRTALPNNKAQSQSENRPTPGNVGTSAIVPQSTEPTVLSPMVAGEADGHFDAAAFAALASQLDGDRSVQQHAGLMQAVTPHQGHVSEQLQHQSQMEPQNMSATASQQSNETLQAAAPRPQKQRSQQQHIQQQVQHAQQPQHPQAVSQTMSPAPSQHSSQPQMQQMPSTMVPSSVVPQQPQQGQQQQQNGRPPQAYYTPSRSNSNQYGQQQQTQQFAGQQSQPQYANQQPKQQQQQQQYAAQYQTASHYSSQAQQPHYTSQQRHQQAISTSSPGLMAQSMAHQSPQFGAANTSGLGSNPAGYGSQSPAGMSFGSAAFSQQRRANPTASPSLNAYGTTAPTGSHGLQQHHAQAHSPAFGATAGAPRQTHPQHPQQQQAAGNAAGVAQNMQSTFHGFDNTSLFDTINLDGGHHGGLGLGPASSYSLPRNAGSAGPAGAAAFNPSAMGSFEGLPTGDMRDRYYGVRR